MYEKFLKYQELNRKAISAMDEMIAEAKEFVENNRKLQPGDVVEVLVLNDDKEPTVLGEGIIGKCKNIIMNDLNHASQTIITWKYYEKNKEDFETRWNDLRYEVFARKKDGKASSKHFFENPHYMNLLEDLEAMGPKALRRNEYVIRIKNS